MEYQSKFSKKYVHAWFLINSEGTSYKKFKRCTNQLFCCCFTLAFTRDHVLNFFRTYSTLTKNNFCVMCSLKYNCVEIELNWKIFDKTSYIYIYIYILCHLGKVCISGNFNSKPYFLNRWAWTSLAFIELVFLVTLN